jgi:hypothetical protein
MRLIGKKVAIGAFQSIIFVATHSKPQGALFTHNRAGHVKVFYLNSPQQSLSALQRH